MSSTKVVPREKNWQLYLAIHVVTYVAIERVVKGSFIIIGCFYHLSNIPFIFRQVQVSVWNQQIAALTIADCNNNHSIETGNSLSSSVALVVDSKQVIVTGNPSAT